MNETKTETPTPVKEVDLSKISVYQLIQMLDANDAEALRIVLFIGSAMNRFRTRNGLPVRDL